MGGSETHSSVSVGHRAGVQRGWARLRKGLLRGISVEGSPDGEDSQVWDLDTGP